MSVLKKFFEMALLLTFILFCINLTILFFGDTFVPNSSIDLVDNVKNDSNIFVEADLNKSYLTQTAGLGTSPTEFENIQTALFTSVFGFQTKLEAMLLPYELDFIARLIGYILDAMVIVAIIYLGAAAIGTPLGGSVP